jgi:hypothetical protein
VNDSGGGRLLLRKIDSVDAEIEYRGEIVAHGRTWASRFRVRSADGKVESVFDGSGEPPPWLVEFATASLRAIWRAHREDGRWPRRLERWRASPAETS